MDANPFESAVRAEHVHAATPADIVDGVAPRWVVQPASAQEAADVVRMAAEHQWALLPRGRGRHLALGEPPHRLDVVLSSERLDAVLEHEPADMTVRVQAGCPLSVLADVLAAHGQWLPLDPPHARETTVGGLLAANLAGPLRASQGGARDFLIGIQVVAADASLVSGGGRVVKNVAGYDLPKMHVGALGTLGFIVEATFKVRPRPAHEQALCIPCADAHKASTLALALWERGEPSWLQLVSQTDPAAPWQIFVAAAGRSEEVGAVLERYRSCARDHGAMALSVDDPAQTRREIADANGPRGPLGVRAATLPDRTGHWLAAIRAAAEDRGIEVSLRADLPSGVLFAAFTDPGDPTPLLRDLRIGLEREGGALVVERADASQKHQLREMGGVWGDPGGGLALMRGLKEAFDPERRFAPGRFVGGL